MIYNEDASFKDIYCNINCNIEVYKYFCLYTINFEKKIKKKGTNDYLNKIPFYLYLNSINHVTIYIREINYLNISYNFNKRSL